MFTWSYKAELEAQQTVYYVKDNSDFHYYNVYEIDATKLISEVEKLFVIPALLFFTFNFEITLTCESKQCVNLRVVWTVDVTD